MPNQRVHGLELVPSASAPFLGGRAGVRVKSADGSPYFRRANGTEEKILTGDADAVDALLQYAEQDAGSLWVTTFRLTAGTTNGETVTTGARVYTLGTHAAAADGIAQLASLIAADVDALFEVESATGNILLLVQKIENLALGVGAPAISTTCVHGVFGDTAPTDGAAPTKYFTAGSIHTVTAENVASWAAAGGTGLVVIGGVNTPSTPSLTGPPLIQTSGLQIASSISLKVYWNQIGFTNAWGLTVEDPSAILVAGDTISWQAKYAA